jgi:hypothetical protein
MRWISPSIVSLGHLVRGEGFGEEGSGAAHLPLDARGPRDPPEQARQRLVVHGRHFQQAGALGNSFSADFICAPERAFALVAGAFFQRLLINGAQLRGARRTRGRDWNLARSVSHRATSPAGRIFTVAR